MNTKSSSTPSMMPYNEECCILCEFPNEGNSIQVAYQIWLTTKYSDDELDMVISKKEIVTIEWPENVDVMPPPVMKKKKVDSWSTLPTRILAKGNWTAMCELIRTYLTAKRIADEPAMNKADRKLRAAKVNSEDDADVNEDDVVKNKKQKRNRIKASKRKLEETILKQQGHVPQTIEKSSSVSNKNKFAPKSNKCYDSSDEDDENVAKIPKKHLLEKISVLTEENKRIKQDNARLRALRTISEGLPEMLVNFKALRKELRANNTQNHISISSYHTKEESSKVNFSSHISANTDEKIGNVDDESLLSNTADFQRINRKVVTTNEISESASSPAFTEEKIDMSSSHMSAGTEEKIENYVDVFPNTSAFQETISDEISQNASSPSVTQEKIDMFEKKLAIIEKVSRDNFQKSVANGLKCLFTTEELATSSLCGGVANCDRGKKDAIVKRKLDPIRIEYLKKTLLNRLVTDELLKTDEVLFKREFSRAVINKCGTEKKKQQKQSSSVPKNTFNC